MLIAALLIPFGAAEISAEEDLFGDLNADGILDASDLALLKRFLVGEEDFSGDMLCADMDGSGTITHCDYVMMMRMLPALPIVGTVPGWILEPKNTLHYGEATYYDGGYENGCASLEPISEEYFVAAMNQADYNMAMLAGAYIEVTGPGGTVDVLITDLLPEGAEGDVDLNINAFAHIARLIDGRVDISWRIIPLPTNEPVSWKFKDGSTRYWCGVQVRNHRYPVAKLEYLNAQGVFTALERKEYNYFVSYDMGEGPFTFRVTDIYGAVFIDEDIPLQTGDPVPGQGQFPE